MLSEGFWHAKKKKPGDSRSPPSTPQAWHPEDFQKLGNTASVSYNLLPTLNSKHKADRSYIATPFSGKANPALTALITTSPSTGRQQPSYPEHIKPTAQLTAFGKIPPTSSSQPNLLSPLETACFSANP